MSAIKLLGNLIAFTSALPAVGLGIWGYQNHSTQAYVAAALFAVLVLLVIPVVLKVGMMFVRCALILAIGFALFQIDAKSHLVSKVLGSAVAIANSR